MAVIDPQQNAVVIRVVYDGPPLAGKTTTVRALAQGLGSRVEAPQEVAGRTLYFDWLDYTGGLFEGRRIRCQIISVPGQATLATRRRHLLSTADVVVFVGDSTAGALHAARDYLRSLKTVLEKVQGPPIGIVVQANKRDHVAAVPMEQLRTMLGCTDGELAVIESNALDGSGVRETFVFAVRLALDRVREQMRHGQLLHTGPEVNNPQDLLDQLKAEESTSLQLAADSGLKHTSLYEVDGEAIAASAVAQAVQENLDPPSDIADPPETPAKQAPQDRSASTSTTAVVHRPSRAELMHEQDVPERPPRQPTADLPSGMIWPAVNGRLILHTVVSDNIALVQNPNGDWSGSARRLWKLHSPRGARFARIDAGRNVLIDWARMHSASANIISSQRCIVLCADGAEGFRLWQIVRHQKSLRDQLDDALNADPNRIARELLSISRAFVHAAELCAAAPCWLPLSLRNVGASSQASSYLGYMPDPRHVRAAEPRSRETTLKLLWAELEYSLPSLSARRDHVLRELDRIISGGHSDTNDPLHRFTRSFLQHAGT